MTDSIRIFGRWTGIALGVSTYEPGPIGLHKAMVWVHLSGRILPSPSKPVPSFAVALEG